MPTQDTTNASTSASGNDWQPDDFLAGYETATLTLGADPDHEDPITATLIRHPAAAPTPGPNGAVLYVHGFTDYFFHEPLADYFADRGYSFYALDLRKCGRSRRPGNTPHYTTDLRYYDDDLGAALDAIGDDLGTDVPVLIGAHSTGGLITPLWLDRLRAADPQRHARISGLLLNSPWFDLQGEAFRRTYPITVLFRIVAATRPKTGVPQELSTAYGESIHDSVHGEWSYDLTNKPLGGFPVTFGFLSAVRTGQRHLHHGIDVGVPSLVLRSDKTYFGRSSTERINTSDVVLDVGQIAQWSGCLGNRVTTVPIADARHDVFLSVLPARTAAYREVDRWLAGTLGASFDTTSTDEPQGA